MRIELSISGSGGSQDVAILAPAAASFAAVANDLADAVGACADAPVWSGGRLLRPDARLGDAGLRTGSLLTVGTPSRDGFRPGVLSFHVVGGPEAGRVLPLERGRLTIGRSTDCDLVLGDDRASRRHAALEIGTTSLRLHDLSSTNGTSVDDVAVGTSGVALRPGQLIRIGDSLLEVCGSGETPASLVPAGDAVLVNRAPRAAAPVLDREIAIPQRVESTQPRRVQWVTALLPAAAGGAIAWIMHSPQFLLFALLSPVMMVSSSLGDRAHWRRSRRREAATYRVRRSEADRAITDALADETTARRTNAPDPAALRRLASTPSSRLWERRRTDIDHLCLRLGSTDLPSTLQVRTGSSVGPAGVLHNVPLCVDLRAGPVGIAGPAGVVAGLSRWLVAQLAVLHSPADVDLVLLLSIDSAPHWTWARWLPHLGGRVATCPDEWQALVVDLTATLEQRRAARRLDPRGWAGKWTVVVVDQAARLTDIAGLAALLAGGAGVGLSAVCVDTEAHALPTSCATVALVRGESGARVALRTGGAPGTDDALIDRVSPAWAHSVARALAPLVDAGADDSSAVPAACRLLDVLGLVDLDADAVRRRWAASTGRLDTVLGVSADGLLHVDLVADGPHALVAGTTGAGKSELLQSLVAGLAATHPPEELTFLLVDYKGGAAFAECARLPHTAGLVTDLDPQLTRRALQSLHAELRRRERLFAAAGAVDLDTYRECPRECVPRLVIVVDEFATLADELPDFVRGIVGVAQRGRSLGVHLILATQRPGSAVSAEIRANTSVRIALRVTDPAESDDIIDAPDAASIERSRPGRAYLRAGSSLTCFQTARAGGGEDSAPVGVSIEPLGEWRRRVSSAARAPRADELASLVDVLGDVARSTGRPAARSPWLEPLPTLLAAADLAPTDSTTAVAIGSLDLPAEQAQPALAFELASGTSVLVAGGPRSGRTGALAAVALGAATKLAPQRVEIYLIDPVGTLATAVGGLPHVATAIGADGSGLIATLLRRLDSVVARRVASRGAPSDHPLPALLLVIDAWDSFLASQEDAEAVRCAELLTNLLRCGAAAGLTTVVAGDRSLLAPRFAGSFGTRLLLRFADKNDYGLVGVPLRDVPTSMPSGRGIRAADGAEFQIAHVGAAPSHAEMQRTAREIASAWTGAAPSTGAIRIRSLPRQVCLSQLSPREPSRLSIGIAGDAAVPLTIDPFVGSRRLLVAGPPRSGRSTTLCSMLIEACRVGTTTVVAAPVRSPLVAEARLHGTRVIDPADTSELGNSPPHTPTLLLVDDSDAFLDCAAGDQLTSWVRASAAPLAVVVTGLSDDLATTYRGIAAEVRRSRCGLLLRPGPLDGELLGVRLRRKPAAGPPGRGLLIGEPSWGALFDEGEPVPIQVAQP